MKALSKSLLAMAMTLAFGASIASAQMPVQFGLGAGVTIPSGSFSNGLKTGWHGMGLIQFKPASSPVGFQIDGAYQQLGFDGGGGKEQIIDGTGNVIYEFQVSPDTKFGINAGAGFNVQASGVGVFVEGRFHNVFVTGSDFHFIPITAGVRFGGT